MTFSFLGFNNLNFTDSTGGFMPFSFCMPSFFRMPQFPPVSLFTFNAFMPPQLPLFGSLISNPVVPAAGLNFDSFKLEDIPLDGFQPVNYGVPPIKFPALTFDTPLFSFKKSSTGASKKGSTHPAPKTTTSIAEVQKIYNSSKGKKLAEETIDGLKSAQNGYCARAVKNGISQAGLGAYMAGDADDMPDILSNNRNFKEVKVEARDLDKLPAGCVLCYAPGDAGYSRRYGHTETTDGNGRAISFFVNNNIKESDKVRVFVPV